MKFLSSCDFEGNFNEVEVDPKYQFTTEIKTYETLDQCK